MLILGKFITLSLLHHFFTQYRKPSQTILILYFELTRSRGMVNHNLLIIDQVSLILPALRRWFNTKMIIGKLSDDSASRRASNKTLLN